MVQDKEIYLFQEEFPLIKQATGWSINEFADRVGVSRQTINNYASGKYKISKLHYKAMRYEFDDVIRNNEQESEMLKVVLDAFVDRPEEYTDKDRDEIRNKVNMMSPALSVQTVSKKDVSDTWKAITISVLSATAVAAIASIVAGFWRKKI